MGASGDLVAFSFHANKNLTTAEGGCLVMNSEASRVMVRDLSVLPS